MKTKIRLDLTLVSLIPEIIFPFPRRQPVACSTETPWSKVEHALECHNDEV